MTPHEPPRAITSAQLVGILAFTLALFFVVAFATKTLDTYRLRAWRDRLLGDISAMEHERSMLMAEIERRQSMAWVDKVLRSAGYVPDGVVRVIIETGIAPAAPSATAVPPTRVAEVASAGPGDGVLPSAPGAIPQLGDWFHNPHWQAWRELVLGFDGEGGSPYNAGS